MENSLINCSREVLVLYILKHTFKYLANHGGETVTVFLILKSKVLSILHANMLTIIVLEVISSFV